jgi:hypothetical protein
VLTGLSDGECELIAATLAEVSAHLAVDSAAAVEAAGGNPFHLEQLLAAAGTIGPAGPLPPSLHALLGARIDALDQPERTTLDLASVIGREFAPYQVAALADTGPEGASGGPLSVTDHDDPVPASVGRLLGHRLVEPASGGTPYRFKNSLIHEVTYQAMAKRTRAERHARAAAVLAGWRSAGTAVAGHLEHAYRYYAELGGLDESSETLRRQAAGLLAAAGAQALARSDLAWAATLLARAIDLYVDGEPGWATAARQFGEVHVASGSVEQGRALLRAVLDTSTDAVETAHAKLALSLADQATVSAVAATAREVLPLFEAAHDGLGQARARIRIAQERQLHGRHGEAEEFLIDALAHAVRYDAEPERAQALGAVGVSLWRGPVPVPAAIERCRALLAEHGGPRPIVQVTLGCPLAVLLALDDQDDEAHARLTEARRLADELGYAEGTVALPIFEAAVESLAGRSAQALALLDRAAVAAGEIGAVGLLRTIGCEAARLLLDDGQTDAAADRLAAFGEPAEPLSANSADADGLRARIAAARRDAVEAAELAERAVSAAALTDSPVVQAIAALDRAAVLLSIGNPEQASAASTVARRRFKAKGHLPGVRIATRLDPLGRKD